MAKSKAKKSKKTESKKQSSDAITIEKTTLWQILTGVLAVIVIVLLVSGGNGSSGATPQPSPTQPSPSPTAPAGAGEVNLDNARTMGNPGADVVFVEYSSFTCPFCGRHNTETMPLIKENFVDTGDVLFVYKHFPRNNEDIRIANHAECAGEQDAFFEVVERIYQNQQNVADSTLRGYAQELGLDMAAYDECVASNRYESVAREHLAEGQANGVTGTPGFLINGRIVEPRGAQPYQVFQQQLSAALN